MDGVHRPAPGEPLIRRWLVGGTATLAALALAGSGPAGDGRKEPWSRFTLEHARAFANFPLYSAGERVEGLPLVAVLRRDDMADYVSFVYGDCQPDDEAGCAPPVEVQVWPACRRSLASYQATPQPGPVPERVTIRGVPAAFFDEFTRLEMQTGPVTVVVFADSRARATRVARALRAVNGSGAVGVYLPRPSAGAIEGELRC